MPKQHVGPNRDPGTDIEATLEQMRHQIAKNLAIDPDRMRYRDPGGLSRIGVTGNRWQVHYRGDWQDLPWHFDGPLCVTRGALVRQWLGTTEG
jgi:hypothetical protein